MSRDLLAEELQRTQREIMAYKQKLARADSVIENLLDYLFSDKHRTYTYPSPCEICGREAHHLRRGFCDACYQRFWRRRKSAPLGSQKVTPILREV